MPRKKASVKKEKRVVLSRDIQDGMPIKVKKSLVVGIVTVICIAFLLYYFRGIFIAAVVNGEPIYRVQVISELEKQGGKQVLDSLVTEKLILGEAKKKNISVSQEEIASELKKIEDNLSKQGQSIDQVLSLQGMTRESLSQRIRIQKIIEKIVGKDIQVTDKEIDDYLEKNKDTLPEGQKPEELRVTVKQQLTQQKLGQKVQSWIADLQKNAKTLYFVKY